MEKKQTAYLSLGSNLGDKLNNLQDAIFAIHEHLGQVTEISPVYESSAWGFEAEDFYNICIALQTKLEPQSLLDALLVIEKQLGRIWINEEQYFDNIPLTAWEFYIGGYQPAQKWLKDRRERTLESDDIFHYQKIIVALSETYRIMQEINKIDIE